jgi:hypothetical protein
LPQRRKRNEKKWNCEKTFKTRKETTSLHNLSSCLFICLLILWRDNPWISSSIISFSPPSSSSSSPTSHLILKSTSDIVGVTLEFESSDMSFSINGSIATRISIERRWRAAMGAATLKMIQLFRAC